MLPHGSNNTITDVEGVKVGHLSIQSGGHGGTDASSGSIRTGVTVILPHENNIYRNNVAASAHVLNGFGKSVGLLQVIELGRIESPIALTSTLNTWKIADSLIDYLSKHNPGIQSFNPVVGECNDRYLNDAIGRHVQKEHLFEVIEKAYSPNTEEGNVGAGTGLTAFGWKGGIGTSSRICESLQGLYDVGVLALCNTGDPRDLRIDGIKVGKHLTPPGVLDEAGGSIVFVIATNAPLTARQLQRMAKRAPIGLARVGGIISHGSGTSAIAFSNSVERPQIDDAHLTVLFRGVVEASEEAIINSILKSKTTIGRDGNTRHAIPIEKLQNILRGHENISVDTER